MKPSLIYVAGLIIVLLLLVAWTLRELPVLLKSLEVLK